MRKIFFAITAMLTAAACAPRQAAYDISGTWEGGDAQYVFLRHRTDGQSVTLDSALVADGVFRMTAPLGDIREASLAAGSASAPLLLEEEPLTVTIRTVESTNRHGVATESLQITVSDTPEQLLYREFLGTQHSEMIFMLGLAMMGRSGDVAETTIDSLAQRYLAVRDRNRATLDSLVAASPDRVTSAIIIGNQMQDWGLEKTEQAYAGLTPRVGQTAQGRKIAEAIDAMRSVMSGAPAPDFTLTTPDGDALSLSDLRGRYVLLDFWASWCGPCLREAPHLRALYDTYRDRGFEILGVSLDDDGTAWRGAIASHSLGWLHVSSLEGWKCPVAKEYNITAIPAMLLIDPDGNIVATDLRGDALDEKLAEILN